VVGAVAVTAAIAVAIAVARSHRGKKDAL
jgi:hypothetical protein